jgi:methylamine dehydrogenase heavy chain
MLMKFQYDSTSSGGRLETRSQRLGSGRIEMSKTAALILVVLLSIGTFAVANVLAQAPPEEGTTVLELPPARPHWIFVMSPFSGTIEVTNVVLIDGDSLTVLGQLTGGMASTFAIAPDYKRFYMADTYYSRGARGDRTDVLTYYDARKLAPAGEVIIPAKRQMSIPDSSSMGVTPDGRFVLIANMTPATSVTVVDTQSNKVAGEIAIPGCAEILVSGPRQFASLCGDGSVMTTQFDDNAKVTVQKRTSEPFFDIEKDPVFGVPAIVGKQACFVSYHGMVYPLDLAVSPAKPAESWSLVTAADKQQGWRPGGWQPTWGYNSGGLLFVLMHRGGEWSHKDPGTEVWAFDASHHKRVDRLPLPVKANSILVSQDSSPILFAVTSGMTSQAVTPQPATLQEFSALNGKYLGAIKDLAGAPLEIFGM